VLLRTDRIAPPPIPSSASTSSLFFSFSQKHRINGRARSPQFPRRLFERNRFGNDPLAILRSGRLCSVTKRDENPRARQHNPERDVLRNAKDRRGFITRSSLDSREGRSYANVINVVPKSLSYPAKRALGASGTEMGTIRELGEHTHTHTHTVYRISEIRRVSASLRNRDDRLPSRAITRSSGGIFRRGQGILRREAKRNARKRNRPSVSHESTWRT